MGCFQNKLFYYYIKFSFNINGIIWGFRKIRFNRKPIILDISDMQKKVLDIFIK